MKRIAREAGTPRRSRDLQLVLVSAVALVVLMATGEKAWFLQLPRLGLALAFILYVPGYWLVASLFPRKDSLDTVERAGLSIGLSIAMVSVLALLLDSLPWGIQAWSVLLSELTATAVFIVAAITRRLLLRPQEVYIPDQGWRPWSFWQSLSRFDRSVTLFLTGTLLLGLASIAWIMTVPSPKEFTTEFYVLGKEGLAEDYPREPSLDGILETTLGITNRERNEQTYNIQVWVVDPWDRARRTLATQGSAFTLYPGENREQLISVGVPVSGEDLQVEFLLFTGEGSSPYRQLRLWLNAKPR